MNVLEAAAEKLQAALLASLEAENPSSAQQQAKLKRKKDKKAQALQEGCCSILRPESSLAARRHQTMPLHHPHAVESKPAQSDEDTASQQQAARR